MLPTQSPSPRTKSDDLSGTGAPSKADRAEELYKEGLIHKHGRGVVQDVFRARQLFEAATVLGNSAAEAELEWCYISGQGGVQSEVEIIRFYYRAANQGNPRAQCIVGLFYEQGWGGLAADDVQALTWYRRAAHKGHAVGQHNLGDFYEQGRGGLAKNDVEAARWYRRAADQGHPAAQLMLGVFCEEGRAGLGPDDSAALRWYRRAAELGDATAQCHLGIFSEHGFGGERQDDEAAAEYYRRSAEGGDAFGQYNLGVFYEEGRGRLKEDRIEAARWYRRAARQGHEQAKQRLKSLKEQRYTRGSHRYDRSVSGRSGSGSTREQGLGRQTRRDIAQGGVDALPLHRRDADEISGTDVAAESGPDATIHPDDESPRSTGRSNAASKSAADEESGGGRQDALSGGRSWTERDRQGSQTSSESTSTTRRKRQEGRRKTRASDGRPTAKHQHREHSSSESDEQSATGGDTDSRSAGAGRAGQELSLVVFNTSRAGKRDDLASDSSRDMLDGRTDRGGRWSKRDSTGQFYNDGEVVLAAQGGSEVGRTRKEWRETPNRGEHPHHHRGGGSISNDYLGDHADEIRGPVPRLTLRGEEREQGTGGRAWHNKVRYEDLEELEEQSEGSTREGPGSDCSADKGQEVAEVRRGGRGDDNTWQGVAVQGAGRYKGRGSGGTRAARADRHQMGDSDEGSGSGAHGLKGSRSAMARPGAQGVAMEGGTDPESIKFVPNSPYRVRVRRT